jgi:hypothetical protein
VNGVNSALTCTVAAGATTGNGTASVVINDGDLVSIAVTSGAAGVSGAIDVRCTVGLEHTLAA